MSSLEPIRKMRNPLQKTHYDVLLEDVMKKQIYIRDLQRKNGDLQRENDELRKTNEHLKKNNISKNKESECEIQHLIKILNSTLNVAQQYEHYKEYCKEFAKADAVESSTITRIIAILTTNASCVNA